MNTFPSRMRLIYGPFLFIAFCSVSLYVLLDYIFVIRLELPISEEVVQFWLPFALPWVPVLIWLRPRINLLQLKTKKGNLPGLYQFTAAISIAAPTLIAQRYITTATGKLTQLNKISQINQEPLTKYFEIKTYYIDKVHIAVHHRSATSGKNNQYLTYYIDVACPILDTAPKPDSTLRFRMPPGKKPIIVLNGAIVDSTLNGARLTRAVIASIVVLKSKNATAVYGNAAKDGAILIKTKGAVSTLAAADPAKLPAAWLCVEFNREMSNNASNDRKQEIRTEFLNDANSRFRDTDLSKFVYLDRIGANDRHRGYLKALQSRYSSLPARPIILEPVSAPFEARNGSSFGWIFKSFGIGAIVWLIMTLIPKLKEDAAEDLYKHELPADAASRTKALHIFSDSSRMQITALIAAANVLVFLVMVFSGLGFQSFEASDLVKWGGNLRSLTEGGQWWRLITCCFVHGGLMHLLLNMYGLFFAAIFVEPALGKMRYLWVYLFCGIISSVASMMWNDNIVSVGASGAIFGLYGVLIALLVTNKISLQKNKPLLVGSLVFVGINLLVGLRGNYDNAAHIGGVTTGFVAGCILCLSGNVNSFPGHEKAGAGEKEEAVDADTNN